MTTGLHACLVHFFQVPLPCQRTISMENISTPYVRGTEHPSPRDSCLSRHQRQRNILKDGCGKKHPPLSSWKRVRRRKNPVLDRAPKPRAVTRITTSRARVLCHRRKEPISRLSTGCGPSRWTQWRKSRHLLTTISHPRVRKRFYCKN